MSLIELKGFDNRGKVFMDSDEIKRIISDDYKSKAKELFNFYQGHLTHLNLVKTSITDEGNLSHKKLPISYPFEWTPSMFKEVLFFTINLFKELEKHKLTLKDALPENILFDSTNPVFVDFLSLVFNKDLINEDWLLDNRFIDQRFAVFEKMFIPHFIIPYLFLSRGDYGSAKTSLMHKSCNSGEQVPQWKDLLKKNENISLKKYLKTINAALQIKLLFKKYRNGNEFIVFLNKVEVILGNIDVTPLKSAYADYYEEKMEDAEIYDAARLGAKQKSVLNILNKYKPQSVLDLGANTGWYSFMASYLGSKVCSVEADISCADILFTKAKKKQSPVLVVNSDFTSLTNAIFAQENKETPIFRTGLERLGSDLLLVLGLSHHLTLGEGYSIEDMFQILAKLTNKNLVLEFVGLDDDKIVQYPDFFKNLKKYNGESYNFENFKAAGLKHFTSMEVFESNPDTRTIMVFTK